MACTSKAGCGTDQAMPDRAPLLYCTGSRHAQQSTRQAEARRACKGVLNVCKVAVAIAIPGDWRQSNQESMKQVVLVTPARLCFEVIEKACMHTSGTA